MNINLPAKYIFAFTTLISLFFGYNAWLIQRDFEMFNAYDKVCAELPKPHPDCRYAK
jgi:hypothetical protein